MHLIQDLLGKGLGDLENLGIDARGLKTSQLLLSERLGVAIGGVINDLKSMDG